MRPIDWFFVVLWSPFYLVYVLLSVIGVVPYYTRNHDGDGLRFWLGKRWIKPIGSATWRRV